MDDNGQMLVFEVIMFASIVIIALIFLFQLTGIQTIPSEASSDLKIRGNDILNGMVNTRITDDEYYYYVYPKEYKPNKLVHYLLTNDKARFVNEINNILPSNILYNVYIANTETEGFWTSRNDFDSPLSTVGSVSRSTVHVALDPGLITIFNSEMDELSFKHEVYDKYFRDPPGNGEAYSGSLYMVILETWYG